MSERFFFNPIGFSKLYCNGCGVCILVHIKDAVYLHLRFVFLQSVLMVMCCWWMAALLVRAEWRSATTIPMALCVMTTGTSWMPMWSVHKLGLHQMVSSKETHWLSCAVYVAVMKHQAFFPTVNIRWNMNHYHRDIAMNIPFRFCTSPTSFLWPWIRLHLAGQCHLQGNWTITAWV